MYMKPTPYDSITPSATQQRKKYDNKGNGWYFRFDYDNKMSYRIVV